MSSIKIDISRWPCRKIQRVSVIKIQNKEEMKILILSVLSMVSGVPIVHSDAMNLTLATVPEKLRLYQNATGISDNEILSIFKKSFNG